jgi:CMP-N-acetylneuraminic acid synthetase
MSQFELKNILWLIPARSGSKSIPNKNVRLLKGMPLLAYRIKTALNFSDKNDIWCSTNSLEYSKIASSYGAFIPFVRPDSLAKDSSSSSDVVLHAIYFAEQNGFSFDFVCLLEPTSPFIYKDDIWQALKLLEGTPTAEAIVAVKESRPNTIFIQDDRAYLDKIASNLKGIDLLGRQNLQRQITPCGGFYISRWNAFKDNKTFYTNKTMSFLIRDECSLEIDELIDWYWAEFLIEQKLVEISKIY